MKLRLNLTKSGALYLQLIISSPNVELQFKCLCQEGYIGEKCEIPLNKCEDSPCKNGGTCNLKTGSDYECLCLDNWTGPTCEQDVNECEGDVCQNGGTCHNLPGSFRCDCLAAYTGMFRLNR